MKFSPFSLPTCTTITLCPSETKANKPAFVPSCVRCECTFRQFRCYGAPHFCFRSHLVFYLCWVETTVKMTDIIIKWPMLLKWSSTHDVSLVTALDTLLCTYLQREMLLHISRLQLMSHWIYCTSSSNDTNLSIPRNRGWFPSSQFPSKIQKMSSPFLVFNLSFSLPCGEASQRSAFSHIILSILTLKTITWPLKGPIFLTISLPS